MWPSHRDRVAARKKNVVMMGARLNSVGGRRGYQGSDNKMRRESGCDGGWWCASGSLHLLPVVSGEAERMWLAAPVVDRRKSELDSLVTLLECSG